jgi:hypothetical protein
VHDIVAGHVTVQGDPHGRRPIQSPEGRREVGNPYAFHVYSGIDGYVREAVPVDVGREDVNAVSPSDEGTTEPMNGQNRATVALSRPIGGNDVKDPQGQWLLSAADEMLPVRRMALDGTCRTLQWPSPTPSSGLTQLL